MGDKLVEVVTDGLVHSTPDAVLLRFPDIEPVWIPISQLDDYDDDYIHIVIPEWLALKKELDGYITESEIKVW